MSKYGRHGKLRAAAGKAPELAAILKQASEVVSTSPGCRLYLVSVDPKEPDDVWVTEVWDTKEDHGNSLSLASVGELISKAMPLLDGRPEGGQELEVLGGFGL